jgi:hypothetical protein
VRFSNWDPQDMSLSNPGIGCGKALGIPDETVITETNRIGLLLFNMQNRTFGPYL